MKEVWDRCAAELATQPDQVPKVLWNSWRMNLSAHLSKSLPTVPGNVRLIRDTASGKKWLFAMSALVQDLDLPKDLARDLDISHGHALDAALDLDIARARDRARDMALHLSLDPDRAHDADIITRVRKQPITEFQLSLLATNFLQEAFLPNLSRSWPALGLQSLEGNIGDAVLTAPAEFRFHLDGRTVLFNKTGVQCPKLADYDLCFPMTAIPLGRLRLELPKWRENRRHRPLGVLPFLLPGIAELLKNSTWELLPIGEIYAFQPDESLWFKPFDEWTPDDWQHTGHRSLLWDIKKGTVLKAPGVHTRDEIRAIGKPFTKFD